MLEHEHDHDLSYLLDVLDINTGETEEQLDDRLRLQAKEVGVDIEDRQSLATQFSEYSRRSESIDSRASQSTGLTSHFSEERRPSRPSLSFRDYDAFLATGKPNGRHSLSFSPNHSTFSLPLSHPSSPEPSPRRHFRRIRGLSMLRLTRPYASSCPHCPLDSTSQRRAVYKLPCGHRVCTQALRNTVRAAIETARGSIPSCCSKPIPGSLVEEVMTEDEQAALLEKLDLWDETISLAPSADTSRRTSVPVGSTSSRATSSSGDSHEEEPSSETLLEVARITALPEYTTLLASQISQRIRFLAWANGKRTALSEQHDCFRSAMRTSHEAAIEDLAERHAQALSEAEDKQVSAEAELLELHERERLSSATALKHMETYCAGVYSNGTPHGRSITEQDMLLMNNARRERDGMEGKHASAINVLRGEQGRRIRYRVERQEREAQELIRGQRMEELEFERKWSAEQVGLEGGLEGKKRRIEWRWELEMAVLAKKAVEIDDGVGVVRLPTAGWGEEIKRPDGSVGAVDEVMGGEETLKGGDLEVSTTDVVEVQN